MIAFAIAPAAHAEMVKLETLTLNPTLQGQNWVQGTTDYQAGKDYRFVISGTMTATNADTGNVQQYDSYYCYQGCGNNPLKAQGVKYRSVVDPAGHAVFPTDNSDPPYQAGHTYDITRRVTNEAGKWTWSARPNGGSSSGFAFSGTYTVEVWGEKCEPVATVKSVKPDVTTRSPGGDWKAANVGDQLCASDEIAADPDGEATLEFADGSTVSIQPLTQIRIATFQRSQGVVKTQIELALGEVAATVKKSTAVRSDFAIRSPTATASTRGTKWTMLYDPIANLSVISVTESSVAVDAANSKDVVIDAGEEVAVSDRKTSAIAEIGHAGVPKGAVTRAKALAAIAKVLGAADACGIEVDAVGMKPIKKGWAITATVSGGLTGDAIWKLVGKKPLKAKNDLAGQITANCA